MKCHGGWQKNRDISGLLALSAWRGDVALNAKLGAVSEAATRGARRAGGGGKEG